jgi:hypothetical protein
MKSRVAFATLMAAAVLLAIWIFQSSRHMSPAKTEANSAGTPGADVAANPPAPMAQRWSLLGGETCEWVIRGVGDAAGSRGLSVECDASPDQQLVLQVDAKVQTGGWTLRVDDGEQAPNWLPLVGHPASRITGSKHYRFLIYSDEPRSEISIKDLAIRPAVDADYQLPLVWPTSGAIAETDQQRLLPNWSAVFGIQNGAGTVAKAKAIANFVYQRSSVGSTSEPLSLGAPREWISDPPRQINGRCGDFSEAMRRFCKRIGITARIANLATERFANGADRFATHVLVEVFDPDSQRWFLADPTFNLTFESQNGQLLGLQELLQTAAEGNVWRAVPIGTLRPGRTIEDYPLKYADLLYAGYVPPVHSLGDLGVEFRTHQLTIEEMGSTMYPATAHP